MADDGAAPAEEVKAEEVKAEGEEKAEEKKDDRSFEERIAALVKPEPVPNPDQDRVNAKLSELNGTIDKCDKRLAEIKAAIEAANSLRDGTKNESRAIVEQLKAVRVRIKAAASEREDIFQQLREMTTARQAQQKNLQDLKRSLKYEDVGQVEAKVRELEAKIEMGQCVDLREEKKVMQEIKNLNATKSVISQYQSQRQTQTDDSELRGELEKRRAEATGRLDAARKEAEVLEKELETMRAKTQGNGPNVNDLWKEQKELYTNIKAHRAEIRKVNQAFKEEVNAWRDFQRAMGKYNKERNRILSDQRRAEWEAKKAEESKPVDEDVPTDDPYFGHPWAEEIYSCMDLEKVLATFLPSGGPKEEAPKEEAKKEVELDKKLYKAAIGKGAVDEEDAFAGLTEGSKKKKGKNKQNVPAEKPKEKKITLTLDTLSSLSNIGVEVPLTAEAVQAAIDKVKEKKKEFEGKTEEEKKAFKSKKSGGKGAAGKGAGSEGKTKDPSLLVNVHVNAPSADKVSVSFDYPALGSAA